MRTLVFLLMFLLSYSTASAQARFEVDLQKEGKSSEVANPVAFDHRIFFSANDEQHGSELWVHEPSTNRTYLLADIFEGISGSFPRNFVQTADYLYFFAKIDRDSDGLFQVARGTNIVERIPGRGTSSNHTDLTLFKGRLMVGTEFALSERDLATNREQRLHPITGSNSANIKFLGQDDDYLYFSSYSLTTSAIEIFRYDGNDVLQLSDFGTQSLEVEVREGALVQNHIALNLDFTDRLCLLDLSDNSFRIDSTVELSFHRFDNVNNVFEVFEDYLYIKIVQGLHDIKRYDFNLGALDPSFSVRPWASARWGLESHNGKLYGWMQNFGASVDSIFEIKPNGNHLQLDGLVDVVENIESTNSTQNQFSYLDGKLYGYGDIRKRGRDSEFISYDLDAGTVSKIKDINQGSLPSGFFQIVAYDQDWLVISGRLDTFSRTSASSFGRSGVKLYNPTTRELRDVTSLHSDLERAYGLAFRHGDELILLSTSIRGEPCNIATYNLATNELICADTVGVGGDFGIGFAPPIAFNGKLYYGDQNENLSYVSFLESFTPGVPGSRTVADPDSIIIIPTGAYNYNMFATKDALYMIEGTNIYTRPGPDFKLVRMDTNEVFSTVEIDTFTISGNTMRAFSDRIFWQFNFLGHIAYFKEGQPVKQLMYNGEPVTRITTSLTPIETDTSIIFNSDERIYSMHKTTDEVQLIVDLDSITNDLYRNTYLLGKLDNSLFFSTRQYVGGSNIPEYGVELYQYNLTTGVVSLAADINPGTASSRPNFGAVFKDRFYFAASDGYRDQELWSFAPNCFTISFSVTADSSNTSPNGTGVVVPDGGVGPYTFLWSNGDTTSTVSGLPAGFVEVTVTDSEGCTTSTNGWIESLFSSISVSDASEQRSVPLTIYPNPTRGLLNISADESIDGDFTTQLFDVSGRLLLSKKHKTLNQQTIDLSAYANGIYFLQLENRENGYRAVKKIIKE